jgi:dihydrofolate reductase
MAAMTNSDRLSARQHAARPWIMQLQAQRPIMRRIVVSAFTSLDGVMQAPGGPREDLSGGFALGGWTAPHFDEQTGAVMDEILGRPFDLLLGRKTYDIFASYWPRIDEADSSIARLFNRVTKYVASRANPELAWQNSRLLGADVVETLRTLKRADGPDLLVQGSSDFLQTLWRHGLVDDLRVLIFPLVLGKGKRLFADGGVPMGLQLVEAKNLSTGVIVAKYVPNGAVKTGEF